MAQDISIYATSKEARERLEWSWNYAEAEGLADEPTKSVARAIAAGIRRGEDQTTEALIEDFVVNRILIGDGDLGEWLTGDPIRVEVVRLIGVWMHTNEGRLYEGETDMVNFALRTLGE